MINTTIHPQITCKPWGREELYITNEFYTFKKLFYNYAGDFSSAHFHKKKTESWMVVTGSFKLKYFNPKGKCIETFIKAGEFVHLPCGEPHQLIALEDGSFIFEVSTPDDPDDVVRISPSMEAQ